MSKSGYVKGSVGMQQDNWNSLVVEPVKAMWADVISLIPDIVNAVYILVFGWIIAKIVQFVSLRILKVLKFDDVAEKIGLNEVLKTKDSKGSSHALSGLFFWIVIVLTVVEMLDALSFSTAAYRFDVVVNFVGNLFTAMVILIIGLFLSAVASKIITTTAKSLEVAKAEIIASVIKWIILVFALIMAVFELGVPQRLMTSIFGVIMIVIAIVVGLTFLSACIASIFAFGVGGREWASKVLHKTLGKKLD